MLVSHAAGRTSVGKTVPDDRLRQLSVIVPTLDAGASLASALASVSGHVGETIVVDGGSVDDTRRIAESAGARVIDAKRGRGTQLDAGALAARSDWFLFLHADSRPEPGWQAVLGDFLGDPANAERAGVFRFAVDLDRPLARSMERYVAWRTRVLGLPYGDQGLVISRKFYDAVGGFRDIPIMEDVDLVRRIGRQRLVLIDCAMTTSGARYERAGIIARSLRNLTCLAMYFLGVPPRMIARFYG